MKKYINCKSQFYCKSVFKTIQELLKIIPASVKRMMKYYIREQAQRYKNIGSEIEYKWKILTNELIKDIKTCL